MARDYDHLFKLLIIGDSGKLNRSLLIAACGRGLRCVVQLFRSPLLWLDNDCEDDSSWQNDLIPRIQSIACLRFVVKEMRGDS